MRDHSIRKLPWNSLLPCFFFVLLFLSSSHLLEMCFKAPKVPLDKYFYHWNTHVANFLKQSSCTNNTLRKKICFKLTKLAINECFDLSKNLTLLILQRKSTLIDHHLGRSTPLILSVCVVFNANTSEKNIVFWVFWKTLKLYIFWIFWFL